MDLAKEAEGGRLERRRPVKVEAAQLPGTWLPGTHRGPQPSQPPWVVGMQSSLSRPSHLPSCLRPIRVMEGAGGFLGLLCSHGACAACVRGQAEDSRAEVSTPPPTPIQSTSR